MTDITHSKRPAPRASGLALVVFLAVYAAAMAVLLLPRDAIMADPGAQTGLED